MLHRRGPAALSDWPFALAYRSKVMFWRYRSALRTLVSRDLHHKYRKFRIGYLWAILEPLGMSVTMWFVFEVLLGGRRIGAQPYFLFLTVAILPWWWFTSGIAASTRVFLGPNRVMKVSQLPTNFPVARIMVAKLADFALSLPLVVAAMVITWTFPGPLIIFFFLAIAVQFVLMYGLALLVASVAAVIPDFARIVRIALRAGFYLTPVLYSLSNIPSGALLVSHANPLVGILGLYRVGWWPEEHATMSGTLISAAIIVILVGAGLLCFRLLEPRILKEA